MTVTLCSGRTESQIRLMMYPFSSGFQDDPDVRLMMAGSTLRKVKSRSWKKQRHFRLLEDGLTIWYKSRWAGKGHSTCECSTMCTTCLHLFIQTTVKLLFRVNCNKLILDVRLKFQKTDRAILMALTFVSA